MTAMDAKGNAQIPGSRGELGLSHEFINDGSLKLGFLGHPLTQLV